jgi:broad specificity phosphatase PhoE
MPNPTRPFTGAATDCSTPAFRKLAGNKPPLSLYASRLNHSPPSIQAPASAPSKRPKQSPHAILLTSSPRRIFGDFEGRTYDDIAATHSKLYRQWMETPAEVRFPNGENFAQMRVRVLDAYRRLLARRHDQTVGIIAHGGVIRIILADALGIPDANIFRVAQRYAALNLIRYFDGYPSIELVNAS